MKMARIPFSGLQWAASNPHEQRLGNASNLSIAYSHDFVASDHITPRSVSIEQKAVIDLRLTQVVALSARVIVLSQADAQKLFRRHPVVEAGGGAALAEILQGVV